MIVVMIVAMDIYKIINTFLDTWLISWWKGSHWMVKKLPTNVVYHRCMWRMRRSIFSCSSKVVWDAVTYLHGPLKMDWFIWWSVVWET